MRWLVLLLLAGCATFAGMQRESEEEERAWSACEAGDGATCSRLARRRAEVERQVDDGLTRERLQREAARFFALACRHGVSADCGEAMARNRDPLRASLVPLACNGGVVDACLELARAGVDPVARYTRACELDLSTCPEGASGLARWDLAAAAALAARHCPQGCELRHQLEARLASGLACARTGWDPCVEEGSARASRGEAAGLDILRTACRAGHERACVRLGQHLAHESAAR